MVTNGDSWSAGATYEQFMGRWSRSLAPAFLDWLDPAPGLHWLEVGCGTGALTRAIADRAAPASLIACDPAVAFIEFARTQHRDERVTFAVAGADDFPQREAGYHRITSMLALNFFPDAPRALRRMRAALAAGGVVSACVWDYADGMEFLQRFWDAAIAVRPAAVEHDEARRFSFCNRETLTALFGNAGLQDVACDSLEITTVFSSFEDYWTPLLGGTGPAPAFVAMLGASERDALRDRLKASLPTAADGTIPLHARAWAVRGSA